VAVIDFQNNGSPGSFVAMAEAFEIPWILICDNDSAGKGYMEQIRNLGFSTTEIDDLVRLLPEANTNLEQFLVKNGFLNEYLQILEELKVKLTNAPGDPGFENEVVSKLWADKTHYIIKLIEKLRSTEADEKKVPKFFGTAISDVIKKAG
jgi:putative ATP-dependent endonuclease of OLD family